MKIQLTATVTDPQTGATRKVETSFDVAGDTLYRGGNSRIDRAFDGAASEIATQARNLLRDGWQSVKESAPPEGEVVFVKMANESAERMYLRRGVWCAAMGGAGTMGEVEFWQPLK